MTPLITSNREGPFAYTVSKHQITLLIRLFTSIPLNPQAFLPLLNIAKPKLIQHILDASPNFAKHWLSEKGGPLVFQCQGLAADAGFQAMFYAECVTSHEGIQ